MNRKKKYDIDSNIQPHFLSYSEYDGVITSEDMSEISGQKLETIIRLNANENPYGTDPNVIKSLHNLQTHLYPDPNQKKIRLALSKYTGISSENLMAGAGGDEILGGYSYNLFPKILDESKSVNNIISKFLDFSIKSKKDTEIELLNRLITLNFPSGSTTDATPYINIDFFSKDFLNNFLTENFYKLEKKI